MPQKHIPFLITDIYFQMMKIEKEPVKDQVIDRKTV